MGIGQINSICEKIAIRQQSVDRDSNIFDNSTMSISLLQNQDETEIRAMKV